MNAPGGEEAALRCTQQGDAVSANASRKRRAQRRIRTGWGTGEYQVKPESYPPHHRQTTKTSLRQYTPGCSRIDRPQSPTPLLLQIPAPFRHHDVKFQGAIHWIIGAAVCHPVDHWKQFSNASLALS